MEYNSCDPLSNAVKRLFGLSYLFPYQRLVIANMIEAALAAGIEVQWPDGPEDAAQDNAEPDSAVPERALDDDADSIAEGAALDHGPLADISFEDGASLGRQIVILPTGAGKSLCFQLPAMLFSGPTLVIYPILSLMADQERRLTEKGFSPVLIRGGQTEEEREAIWKKLRSGESKFIIANPEVLISPRVKEKLSGLGIVHTVIDEAHCVSEWGESFRPSYLEIHSILEAVQSPLVTAFTATASAPVLEKIEKYIFGENGAHRITGNPDRPNIEYAALGCILKDLAVRDLLLANFRPAIVFCSSRPGTEHLARYLRNRLAEEGVSWAGEVRFYHAGLSRDEKKELETWYLHNAEAVLVSTCAFGLGVDKADIRTVIHRDCPPSVEAYLQESGRAGRDGGQSRAVLLWGPEDAARLALAKTAQDKTRVEQLLAYARDHSLCRREALLRLLNYEGNGDKPEKQCCDVCSGQSRTELREERSLENFFSRNRRSYTVNEAARILAESETVHWSAEEAKEALKALIQKGILKKIKGPFWKDKITVNAVNARRHNLR
ncbi:MAG: RecQ family ATP-dependent DNA helicase [Spirochaetaceae bacterium]|nr:RecQ family ATP-dependent DNA helicase [Spirochaetaceae bacterium]